MDDYNLLDLMLDIFNEQPEQVLSRKNLIEELNYLENSLSSKDANEYMRKNPKDIIGVYGQLFARYAEIRPLHMWSVEKMLVLSQVTVPFLEAVKAEDENAEISASLDTLTGKNAIIEIKTSSGSSVTFLRHNIEAWRNLMEVVDEVEIFGLLNERVNIVLVFKNVKTPREN